MKLVTFKSENSDQHFRLGAFFSETEIFDLTTLAGKERLSAAQLIDCFDLDGDFLKKAESAITQNDVPLISKDKVKICAPVPAARQNHLYRVELPRPCRRKRHGNSDFAHHFF